MNKAIHSHLQMALAMDRMIRKTVYQKRTYKMPINNQLTVEGMLSEEESRTCSEDRMVMRRWWRSLIVPAMRDSVRRAVS